MPRFLIDNVDKAIAIRNFVKTNIDGISVERVHTYIMENIFPYVADNFVDPRWEGNEDEDVQVQITIEDLFKHYNLKNFSHSTAYRWMIALGMRYCDRRKNYYVDGHEREDVVEARWRFVRNYLRDELQMHRWIQLSETEIVAICGNKFDKDMLPTGFKYEDPVSRETKYEFHVDSNRKFQEQFGPSTMGGNLSVRKGNKKTIIQFGHDEAIFNMNAYSSKCWNDCDGAQPICQKSEGAGIMYSALQSREFGFGFRELTNEEIEEINGKFRRGKHYRNSKSAKAVNKGRDNKTEFQKGDNLFIRAFEFGVSKQGYWSYDHLIIQIEDCFDVLNTLFGSTYKFRFLVDHSCGHDRECEDALNVHAMNKEFGGKQRIIHDSLLTKGCLGTYNPKFKVGDTQSFTFCESSSGPFFMSPLERETLENGDLHDSKFMPIPKNILLQRLFEKGVFINLDIIRIANCEFHIDHQNCMLYGKDKKLSANEIRSLCEDRHIDPHAFQQQRPSNNTLQALVKHLNDNIPPHETVKFQNRVVHIDRLNNCIWKRNNVIPTMYVRKLCRENDIEWKEQKPCVSNSKEVDKSIKELLQDLTNDGHFIPRNRMKKADLISFANKYDIPIKKTVETQVSEGWVGKAKGKLQIAFEGGLLNLEKYCVEEFPDKGKKDENGNVIQKTSLNELLASCSDFIEEESMLQKNIKDLGGKCIHSPKYHCEIAGEGIEYSWGNSKMKYRRSKMRDRDSYKKFCETVEECLSRTYLTVDRVRMNSRRAHEYIVAYFILSISDDDLEGMKEFELDSLKPQAVSASKIEQLKEKVRSHRAALDFDTSFCKATVCMKEESQM